MPDPNPTQANLQEILDHARQLTQLIPTLTAYLNTPTSSTDGETPHIDLSGTSNPTANTITRNLAAGNRAHERPDTPARPWKPAQEHDTAQRLIREARDALLGARAAVLRVVGREPPTKGERSCVTCGRGPIEPRQMRRGECPACHQRRRRRRKPKVEGAR